MDLSGKKFGSLLVIKRLGHKYGNHINYLCVCDCGKNTESVYQQLVTGNKISCGCSRNGVNSTHGMSKKRFYRIWFSMKQRCKNTKDSTYKRYGLRGITYCKEWESFENFKKDMEKGYNDSLTLDRIDVNGNYCKENCRWATAKEQSRNRRSNKIILIDGQEKVLAEWLEIYGRSKNTYHSRIDSGMSELDAIITPPRIKK